MLSSYFHLLTFIIRFVAAQSVCYYPDGTPAVKDDPQWPYSACNTTAKYSACCNFAEGDICVAGGLCYFPGTTDDPRDYVYRGACTDESWSDGSCAALCSSKSPSHYESLIFCPNTTQFCCQKSVQGGNCCDQADIRFKLDLSPEIMQQLIQGNNGTTPTTGGQRPTSSSSGGSTASASTSAEGPHQSSGLSSGAKAGIIVAALAACILFGVGWFLGRRKNDTWTVGHFVRRLSKQPSKNDVESAPGHNPKSDITVEGEEKPGLEAVDSLVSPVETSEEATNSNKVQEHYELPERGDPVQMPA